MYTKAYAGNSPAEVSSANASYAVGAAGVAIAVIALGIIAIGRLGERRETPAGSRPRGPLSARMRMQGRLLVDRWRTLGSRDPAHACAAAAVPCIDGSNPAPTPARLRRAGGSEVALGDYKTLTEYAAIFAAQI